MTNKIKKRGSYTALSNEIINDSRLKLRELGLFLFMWSKPDDWHFTIKNIAKVRNTTTYEVKYSLQALKRAGYITYEKQKDGTGVYILDDKNREKHINAPKVENQPLGKNEKPKVDEPHVEIRPLKQTLSRTKENINNHGNKASDFFKYFSERDPREIEQEKWERINQILLNKAIMTSREREQLEEWRQAQLHPIHDGDE